MKDMLVYSSSFEIEKDSWGYKWIRFYNGKRFAIIFDSQEKELMIDELLGKYIYCR